MYHHVYNEATKRWESTGVIQDRREMLKLKLMSLVAERRIILLEERKWQGPMRDELWAHRTKVVRAEARATHLAYGIIRGKSVGKMETPNTIRPQHVWHKVIGMVKTYGPTDLLAKTRMINNCGDGTLGVFTPAEARRQEGTLPAPT